MTGTAHEKVKPEHLKRNAYLYIRQSTLRQVLENTESTLRQYDLRQQAVALGWPIERIIVEVLQIRRWVLLGWCRV